MAQPTSSLSFNQPNLGMLRSLGLLQWIALGLLTLIAGTVLCGWLVTPTGNLLPASWHLMKANTAILILLSGLGLLITHPLRPSRSILIGRLLGILVALIAAITLAEYALGRPLGIDTLFAVDPNALFPGRMSIQTALSLLLMGIVLQNIHARKGVNARIVDLGAVLLLMSVLVYTAGYVFGAMGLFGVTPTHRLSPQTLICLGLLTFIVFSRITEYGSFSILIDDGIGGKTARLTAPCALLLPFIIAELRGLVMRFHLLQEQYGVALGSAAVALVGFCFVVFLARRCQQLEAVTRELSFCDQLTHVYNRRGFFLFAEQSLRLARRNKMEFFLLVIDMDNLKKVNDNLGHETGSQKIQQMAQLLQATFRESDVIGRIGGDEFVVAGNGNARHVTDFVTRLEFVINAEKHSQLEPYPLSFSLGRVIAPGDSTDTLETMLRTADIIMYEVKRSKKVFRSTAGCHESTSLHMLAPQALPLLT